MCRDDGEPEEGCDCDYCVGYATGYYEGEMDGYRSAGNHANSFAGISGR